MPYITTVRAERFTFADLRDLFAKANERKSGDELAGIAAASANWPALVIESLCCSEPPRFAALF